jgi:branched-chain amino acid transport system permease protein
VFDSWRRDRLPGVANLLVCAALVAAPLLLSDYLVYVIALVLTNAIAVISVSFLLRYAGEVSIGQNLFMAVGAYAVAILRIHYSVPFPLDLLFGLIVSAVIGLIVAFPSRQLSGIYLSVATLAVGLTVPELASVINLVFGGSQALFVPLPKVVGVRTGVVQYGVALSTFLLTVGAAWRFRRSRQGLALIVGRDHGRAAESFGVSLRWRRLSAFTISAAIAGVSGGVFAYVTQSVAADSFTFWNAVYLLVGATIGLRSLSLLGSLGGSLFITVLPQVFAGSGAAPPILFGLALYLCVLTGSYWKELANAAAHFAGKAQRSHD